MLPVFVVTKFSLVGKVEGGGKGKVLCCPEKQLDPTKTLSGPITVCERQDFLAAANQTCATPCGAFFKIVIYALN